MHYFLTGTDTDVGKTIAAAWLMLKLDAAYWKPVQVGRHQESDEQVVRRLTGFPEEAFARSSYVFPDPLSPHYAAERCGAHIDMEQIKLPSYEEPLIVEAAGGVLVPLNENALMVDLMVQLALPVILVARTGLGTINHTLMSLEALRARDLTITGVILNGNEMPHNTQAIETYGKTRILGQIPPLAPLTGASLMDIPPLFELEADGTII
ncbi:MAG: dethiobiotin synthase [bacterium]|nr:dethiobiotin synthase [bacterium]